MVERFNGIEEVNGSIPLCSSLRLTREEADERCDAEAGHAFLQLTGLDRNRGRLPSMKNMTGFAIGRDESVFSTTGPRT